jgi:hypothetical protein
MNAHRHVSIGPVVDEAIRCYTRRASGIPQAMLLGWQRPDTLARRGEDRVQHRGRGDEHRRLAQAAPEAAGSMTIVSSFGTPRRRMTGYIEVPLLDRTVLYGANAVKAAGRP